MVSLKVEKRLLVWLLETASQAVLVGWVIVALLLPQQIREAPSFHPVTLREVAGVFVAFPLAVFFMFLTSCYVFTTAAVRALWPFHNRWPYSVVAVVLFLIHFEIVNVLLGGAFEPSVRTPLLLSGLVIALLTTAIGTRTLRKWERPKVLP